MSQSDWETDSEFRQFRPGRYAMRQLGRSVSRRTKQLLLQQPAHHDSADQQPQPSGGYLGREHSARAATYRRGPPLPSGIHRRSVSFDNLPMFPGSVGRSSTEPGMSTAPTSPSIGLPAASTWSGGWAAAKDYATLAGLAHPLSTAVDSAQLAIVVGPYTGTRESFSGAAQLDASTHMTNSPRSPLDASDPFQNRHLWISEEDLALEAQSAPVPAPQVTFQAVQIAPSAPVGSERAAGGARKLGNIARVISTLSRKLHRMRSQRSASQPATPAEVRRSILASARQNMIHVPNDPAHDFYRFLVNPADPVSDRESSAPDSPTISRHASSGRADRRGARAGGADAGRHRRAGADSARLPPVGPASPVFSSESLHRLCESISRAPSVTPASSFSHRRSASASASVGAAAAGSGHEPHMFLTNQGHNGSVSELVLAKLESEFVDKVRVSTRLATGLSAESSYGTFVRFHNSCELSGIFAADRAPEQQQQQQQQQQHPTPAMQQGLAPALAPTMQQGPDEAAPARYARNHDNVSRFVEEVRAVRQDSAQRQVEAQGQRQVLNNSQALLDAAMHVYERQQRHTAAAAAAAAEARRQVSKDPATPLQQRINGPAAPRRQRSKDPAAPRRRVTMFGMFCAPTVASVSPSTSHAADLPALPTAPESEAVDGASRKSQVRRSQSLPRIDSSAQQPAFALADGRWTQEDLHVSWHRRGDQRQAAAPQQPERASYPLQTHGAVRAPAPAPAPIRTQGMSHEPAPSAAPRTRSGFLAGMLGILSSGGRATGRAPSPLPLPPPPRLPPPSVALSVPAQSLSDEICAGITRSAQDATLSSTGRRMYSEVLLSLRDPDDPADPADPADQAQQNPRPAVRFEQRPAPQPQPPARTSSVAMDAITAAKRRAAAADAPSRGMAQSTPHSRAMSSDDSLADMLASADGSERFGGYRVPDLPGLESYGGTPVPANARLRRLEDEVLHGVSRPATAVLASFDAPPSDAGTGRTQILDFAEADVRAPAAQLQRRPSARPEIRDVRAILWADTNPTSTAAASADLKSASDPKIMSDPKVMSDPKSLVLAAAAPNGPPPDPKILSDSEVLSDPKILSDSKGLHDPLVLARLVHTSPDPRSLIYDAASQFGSMRSRPSLGSPKPEAEPKPEAKLMLEAPAHPDALSAHSASMPAPSSSHPSLGASAAVAAFEVPAPDELSMHRRSRQFAQVTDSEALAHASVQATMSGESPAIAAKTLAQQQPLRAYSHAQPSAASGKRGERPMSLQEYVEQQKLSVHHRATPTGHEQLNFRVSLLERTPPEYNRKSRSVSLPPPHSRLPALPFDILQPAIARPSLDRPVYIPRPAATHQRTKSFYDSPPLAQALLLPEWPKAAAVSGQSQEQSLADDELAERALFSHLLGDGAALTSPDLKVARRQSGAQPLVQTAPPLFDPEIDTGENGVPDSVLRAYLAGDLTAIERFFEHIMRITAPSSIYDGEVSEDGDWTFGLEGPPPEVLAEREAARKELVNASREVPDMIDASAEASRVAASSTNLQQAPAVSEHMLASASSSSPAAQTPVIWPDLQTSASVVTPVDVRAMPLAELLPQPSPSPMAEEASAVHDDGGAVSSEAPASNGASNASKPVRRIAVAKSQLARKKREGLHNNSGQSSSTNSADLSGHNCKSNTSASLTNSQRPPDDESCPQPNDEPTSPWDDIDISAAPNQTASVRDIARFTAPTISHPPPVEAEAHPQYDKVAACISPGRARSRNRRQSESGARSTIIPSQDLPSGKRQERQILMARLRVLEAMIQKAAIEESRLQPPAVLRKSRLVEDVESIASIYSSSMEMGYERIYQELNNSQRPRADSRRKSADPGALRHSGESARQQQGLADGQLRNLGPGQTPHATARGEVLARLKQGSQARAMSPLRTSVLGRPHLAPAYRPGERSAGANTGGVANTSLLLSDMSEVAYSARSGGSIRIDIVNEGSAPSLSATDTSHFGRTPDYQSSSRFRRTAKLLGL